MSKKTYTKKEKEVVEKMKTKTGQETDQETFIVKNRMSIDGIVYEKGEKVFLDQEQQKIYL